MMNNSSQKVSEPRPQMDLQLGRRQMLFASLAVPFVWTKGVHAQGESFSHFMTLSNRLSGYSDLDRQLGLRIHQSLSKMFPSFESDILNLVSANESEINQSPMAKEILKCWYLGVIGSGEQSSCIAYISTLQVRIVSDVLRPPTYAYGPYGSWSTQPIPA
ncbi:sorbitol dehydrogenase family protein [Gluconobacter oxydans]|uniref:sorbitol dehydrogenase family protein n=1 Tax=Gluconobacter oxydans TaxID=442 RepID=UPI001CD90A74|nr:sorbitol dehydrogenase family protein [Gluconobacter oxydans]